MTWESLQWVRGKAYLLQRMNYESFSFEDFGRGAFRVVRILFWLLPAECDGRWIEGMTCEILIHDESRIKYGEKNVQSSSELSIIDGNPGRGDHRPHAYFVFCEKATPSSVHCHKISPISLKTLVQTQSLWKASPWTIIAYHPSCPTCSGSTGFERITSNLSATMLPMHHPRRHLPFMKSRSSIQWSGRRHQIWNCHPKTKVSLHQHSHPPAHPLRQQQQQQVIRLNDGKVHPVAMKRWIALFGVNFAWECLGHNEYERRLLPWNNLSDQAFTWYKPSLIPSDIK